MLEKILKSKPAQKWRAELAFQNLEQAIYHLEKMETKPETLMVLKDSLEELDKLLILMEE